MTQPADTNDAAGPMEIIPSGIDGLDIILGSGISTGALAFIVGHPGSGKTTLGSQIIVNAAARQYMSGAEHLLRRSVQADRAPAVIRLLPARPGRDSDRLPGT